MSGGGGGVGGRGRVGGGQGGCERRIEVFVKIQKKKLRGGVKVKFLGKFKKKFRGGVLGGGGVSGWGVRVDVNDELKFF